MSNTVDPSTAFVSLIVLFGLFTGGTVFMGDLFDKHNVQGEQKVAVQGEYQDLQNQTRDIDQNLQELTSDQGSLLDTASAGILIVPRTIGLLLQPLQIATATVGGVSSAFPALIPDWFATMMTLLLLAGVGFGIFRILLGVTKV